MGAPEIVTRLKVPPEWEGMSEAIKEKVIIEVSQEIQRRIEEAKKFEEILKKPNPMRRASKSLKTR